VTRNSKVFQVKKKLLEKPEPSWCYSDQNTESKLNSIETGRPRNPRLKRIRVTPGYWSLQVTRRIQVFRESKRKLVTKIQAVTELTGCNWRQR